MSYRKASTQSSLALLTLMCTLAVTVAAAQSDSGTQASPQPAEPAVTTPQPDENAPAPAFGAAGTIPSANENPPISGLDQPSLEPGGVTRSFLAPGLVLSESGDSNINGSFGSGNSPGGVTRAMGSLALQKLWSRYETDAQYIGGGIFYEGVNHSATQIQEGELAQRAVWRTGQIVFRDHVSYLPEGTFGAGSYGGSDALQSGLAGLGSTAGGIASGSGSALGGTFSAGQFGSVGQAPRLTNSAAADVVQSLTPKSSLTFAGSYGFVHFTDNPMGLVDSSQVVAQAGYDRQINRTDQIAVSYGYQEFQFPQVSNSNVTTNVVHFIYGHRVSGRMDFVAGAGPQFTQIQFDKTVVIGAPPVSSVVKVNDNRISASGNAILRYHFPRTSVQLEYRHYNTNGSGSFLGASTDVGSLSVSRPLGRIWQTTADLGVANNKRLQPASVGLPDDSDRYFFIGGAVHRHIGRRYRLFLSYQYNRFSFEAPASTSDSSARVSNRQMGVVGIEWYPRPMRLE